MAIITEGALATWGIAGLATAGVITRPFRWPEAIWAVAGAIAVVAFGLLPWTDAVAGLHKGLDVYLFLAGMMLLAEVARREGLFDWLAALATSHADGSASRLFLLTYIVGAIVTVFLSNDATAVVLTPAVAAAVKAARAEQPVPYLLVCAFIANAASFVLPISNPANLVIYGNHMPPLLQWLPRYLLPSVVSIAATYLALRWTQRRLLTQTLAKDVAVPPLSNGGKTAAAGIAATAVVLLVASAMDIHLGLPTCLAGIATAVIVLVPRPLQTWSILKDISWGVLPLVAGLFVLVEALNQTGVIGMIGILLSHAASISATGTAWAAGAAVAVASNLANNLPVGLIAGSVVQNDHAVDHIVRAVLIGVDLGPNLSVTGSLATILWLTALRREDLTVGFGTFLKIGAVVMPPALVLSIATALLTR
ncbi:MAG TPA: arsenic transporter [Xanthobacteraceae bacterium]|nr:arsenic transporter [Xanthobacteraceae bacterium]